MAPTPAPSQERDTTFVRNLPDNLQLKILSLVAGGSAVSPLAGSARPPPAPVDTSRLNMWSM